VSRDEDGEPESGAQVSHASLSANMRTCVVLLQPPCRVVAWRGGASILALQPAPGTAALQRFERFFSP
jgi:hypothetical protein